MGAHFKLTSEHRAAIADQIEGLIALLDAADAPLEDLEPEEDRCDAADDGCGPLEAYRLLHVKDEPLARPLYGLDQSAGPVNEREANQEFHARELGLVRSPAGGWRRRAA